MTQQPRILVVEDEAIAALDLQRTLTDSGYTVVGIASTCEEALRLAEHHHPDTIILDYSLKGGLNGATVARELTSKNVRVIFLTGHLAEALSESEGIAFDYLAKPFENAHRVRLAVKQAFSRGRAVALGESLNELPLSLDAYEKLALERALREVDGDARAVARALGMGRSTLYRKLAKYGLSARQTACDPSDRNPPAFGAAGPIG